jgi:8-oxo-dGTP diphosphatase
MLPLHVVGAAIIREQRCLVAQRGPAMSLPGKWEFPGGKVEPGEEPTAALGREVREELGLEIRVGPLLGSGSATVGSRLVRLDVYGATIASGTLTLREHAQVMWSASDELWGFDWAEADVPCLPHVQEWLRSGARDSA